MEKHLYIAAIRGDFRHHQQIQVVVRNCVRRRCCTRPDIEAYRRHSELYGRVTRPQRLGPWPQRSIIRERSSCIRRYIKYKGVTPSRSSLRTRVSSPVRTVCPCSLTASDLTGPGPSRQGAELDMR